jgi:hypothetical protein
MLIRNEKLIETYVWIRLIGTYVWSRRKRRDSINPIGDVIDLSHWKASLEQL